MVVLATEVLRKHYASRNLVLAASLFSQLWVAEMYVCRKASMAALVSDSRLCDLELKSSLLF